MSYFLGEQARQFLMAMFVGMILSAIYDVIRIFRNIVRHRRIWISIEDFIFWNFVGVFLYIMIFYSNNGILRWFIIGSALLGAGLYHRGIGRFVVKYLSLIINTVINNLLKKPIKKAKILLVKLVKYPMKLVKGKLYGKKIKNTKKIK